MPRVSMSDGYFTLCSTTASTLNFTLFGDDAEVKCAILIGLI